MTALTNASNAIVGIMQFTPVIIFSVLAFWKLHPVLFIFTAAVAYVTGCYAPDILTNGATNTFSLTIALSFVTYSLSCVAFSFITMFKG